MGSMQDMGIRLKAAGARSLVAGRAMVWLAGIMLLTASSARAEDLSAFAFDQQPGALVPLDQPLQAEDGRTVTLRQVGQGRPMLLVLGYFHCPNLCGVVRDDLFSALSQSHLAAARDYELVAVSIDPAETAADAARAKADDMARYPLPSAGEGWHFLTAGAAGTAALQAAVGFHSRFDSAAAQFLHPSGLVLLTPAGAVSGYILGVGYQPAELERGVQQASAGVIGPAASAVLLLCFHYDPVTGRYSLAITKLLRIAAALVVLTLGVTLVVAHRRDRAA